MLSTVHFYDLEMIFTPSMNKMLNYVGGRGVSVDLQTMFVDQTVRYSL